MSTSFRIGQLLRGKVDSYTITKKVQETVWLAKDHAEKPVIVKFVHGHHRVANERNVLRHFHGRSPFIRPLQDEIEDSDDAEPTIVLRYFEDDLLSVSKKRSLTSREIKYVSKRVLEALDVLHTDNFIHTDVKPDNVLINYYTTDSSIAEIRFSDVQLADFGSVSHVDSEFAREGAPIGAPIWRSPEAQLNLPWNTATDIWSFGIMIISLIYGGDFNIFRPRTGAKFGDEDYELQILIRQFQYFGPFPEKYGEYLNGDEDAFAIIMHILNTVQTLTPFSRTTEKEVCKTDNEFICKIMRMDPRDRPTAKELLQDIWFKGVD